MKTRGAAIPAVTFPESNQGLVDGRAYAMRVFATMVVRLGFATHPPVRPRSRRDRVHGHDERRIVALAGAVIARASRLPALRKKLRLVAGKALRREEAVAAILASCRQQRNRRRSSSRRALQGRRGWRRRSILLAAPARRRGDARFQRMINVLVVGSIFVLEARRRSDYCHWSRSPSSERRS